MIATYWAAALGWDYLRLPSRQLYEVAFMWPTITIATLLIASIAQCVAYVVLALLATQLLRRFGHVSLLPLLAATPILGLLAWYGYDYLVPGYRWYTDERPPYEHGITGVRFLLSWGFEIIVVIGYWLLLRPLQSSARRNA
jgi:hypothetical protein